MNARAMARAMGRATGVRSMVRAMGQATHGEPLVSRTQAPTAPARPTGPAGSPGPTLPPTSLRVTAYLFAAVTLAVLLWYQATEDFSVPYSQITPALIFSAALSVAGAHAATPGVRLMLLVLASLVAEELVAWFGLGMVASFVLLVFAIVLLIAALNDVVTGPFLRVDVLRGLRIGAVSVAILTGIDVLLELGFISSVGLTVSGLDLLLASGLIAGTCILAWLAEPGQRRNLAATGAGLLALTGFSHLIAYDVVDSQQLAVFLGVAALVIAIEPSAQPLVEVEREGGALAVAWGQCLMWVRARWAQLLAFGFFGALVSLLWTLAGLLLMVVLPLMLILGAAEGEDVDSGWGIALFAGAVALPQLAGLAAGAGSVVVDQAMAASLLDGRMDVRSFWRSITEQWRTSVLLALGYFFGYLVCFIPGLILVVRWGFALPFGVRDKQYGSSALAGSWRLTAGYGWTVLGFQVLSNIAVLLAWGVGLLLAYACEWLWGSAWLSAAVITAVWGFAMVLSAIARVSLFERFTASPATASA